MARKTAGLEEFDLLRVQVRRISTTATLVQDGIRHKHGDVVDNLKQGFNELIQKTRRLTARKEKSTPQATLKHAELVERPPFHHASAPTGDNNQLPPIISGLEDRPEVGSDCAGVKAGAVDMGSGDDTRQTADTTKLVVFTDHHLHGSKNTQKNNNKDTASNSNSNSNNNNTSTSSTNESLVVGPQNAFKGLHTIIGVPGWANKDNDTCVCDVWAQALHCMCFLFPCPPSPPIPSPPFPSLSPRKLTYSQQLLWALVTVSCFCGRAIIWERLGPTCVNSGILAPTLVTVIQLQLRSPKR